MLLLSTWHVLYCTIQMMRNTNDYRYLGLTALQKGHYSEAIDHYQQILRLYPNDPQAWNNLGLAYKYLGKQAEAITCYQKALDMQPDFHLTHHNLGEVLQQQGKLTASIYHYREALRHSPNYPASYNNLASVLFEQGHLQVAIQYYQQALEKYEASNTSVLDSDYVQTHSNLIFSLWALPNIQPTEIFKANQKRARRHAGVLYPKNPVLPNHLEPKRRLKIGYVAVDFCRNSASANFMPFFRHHDRQYFEIFAYADILQSDQVSQRFQELADHWCPIGHHTYAQVVKKIQQDGIDILVDLSGRTAKNFQILACQPAPIQVSAFGLGHSSTGLETVQYRFSDPMVAPLGGLSTEQLVYLPSWIPWEPPEERTKDEGRRTNVGLVFGCGNSLFKMNERVLHTWSQILKQLPEARLHLKSPPFEDQPTQQFYEQRLKQYGISTNRLIFSGKTSQEEHLSFYQSIDISLDPFPYNGGISTCESLLMGRPVVTMAGGTRSGASLLQQIGHPELIADTPEEYIAIATQLGNDRQRLQFLQQTVHAKILNAPLCQAQTFTRAMEDAYFNMWSMGHSVSKKR